MRRGSKNFKVNVRTQIAINNDASESSEIREESSRENVHLLREQVSNHVQNIGRNRDPMDYSD